MRTKNTSFSTVLSLTLITGILLVFTSCGSSETNQSGVKKPSMDIHSAVIANDMKAVKQHIEYGTDIDEKDPFGGGSPLILAALLDKQDMVKVFLEAGADINFTNNDGSTALHTAAFFCRKEVTQILLENGADKNIRNNFGSTAMESLMAPYADVKPIYDLMGQQLGAMGLKIDHSYLETARPVVAEMLK